MLPIFIADYCSLERFKNWLNQDSSLEFSNAKQVFEDGKKMNPQDANLYREFSVAYIERGEIKLNKQESPLPDAQQAQALLTEALNIQSE